MLCPGIAPSFVYCLSVAVYPIGVPALFAYLLLLRFRGTLTKQRDKEQVTIETKMAVKHVDRLHERRDEELRQSSVSREDTQQDVGRTLSNLSAVVAALQQTDLARVSTSSITEPSTEPSADGERPAFGTAAVWSETTTVLRELDAAYLGSHS